MKRRFFAFRYLITQSEQLNLFDLEVTKEELVKRILSDLEENKKTVWSNSLKKYIFAGVEKYKDDLFFLKFARESNNTIYVEDTTDITKTKILEARYIYLIINTKYQIVMIEQNRSIFQNFKTVTNLLAKYFNENLTKNSFHLNIYPLATKYTFWHQVENADSIFQLTLKLNAPNMAFFANRNTQRILKIIKEETNNEELSVALKNSNGKLEVNRNGVGSWIDYIREVGGKYLMKYKDENEDEMKSISSSDDVYNTEIAIEDEFIDEDTKEIISEKIEKISDIDNRE